MARVHNSTIKLRWKVENPDGDVHVYRLWFRQDGEPTWKSLGGSEHEPLTKPEFEWNTESVPDGNYVVRVVASDERSNLKELALEHELVSQPFLIDNRKPEDRRLEGALSRSQRHGSRLFLTDSELAFSVDGGSWRMLAPGDWASRFSRRSLLDAPGRSFAPGNAHARSASHGCRRQHRRRAGFLPSSLAVTFSPPELLSQDVEKAARRRLQQAHRALRLTDFDPILWPQLARHLTVDCHDGAARLASPHRDARIAWSDQRSVGERMRADWRDHERLQLGVRSGPPAARL